MALDGGISGAPAHATLRSRRERDQGQLPAHAPPKPIKPERKGQDVLWRVSLATLEKLFKFSSKLTCGLELMSLACLRFHWF